MYSIISTRKKACDLFGDTSKEEDSYVRNLFKFKKNTMYATTCMATKHVTTLSFLLENSHIMNRSPWCLYAPIYIWFRDFIRDIRLM